MEKKKIKKIIRISSLLIVIFVLIAIPITKIYYPRCIYSEKDHYRRIQKRIEERFIETGVHKEYELYPLYDENDQLKYFVVDFPTNYHIISINKRDYSCISGTSLYSLSITNPWQRYVLENGEKVYEKDKDGNDIFYNQSPYKVAGIKDEKRYLIKIRQGSNSDYVPAVKRGDKYLNLISMKEEEIVLKSNEQINETFYTFYAPKPQFNL
ncbi:MAG: hypothetical protein SPE00_07210 [Bacilli bacterium]|nr:hypothetical protein [Bacilli bacterium]